MQFYARAATGLHIFDLHFFFSKPSYPLPAAPACLPARRGASLPASHRPSPSSAVAATRRRAPYSATPRPGKKIDKLNCWKWRVCGRHPPRGARGGGRGGGGVGDWDRRRGWQWRAASDWGKTAMENLKMPTVEALRAWATGLCSPRNGKRRFYPGTKERADSDSNSWRSRVARRASRSARRAAAPASRNRPEEEERCPVSLAPARSRPAANRNRETE